MVEYLLYREIMDRRFIFIGLLVTSQLFAQGSLFRWRGGSPDMSNESNWENGTAPITDSVLIFPDANSYNVYNDLGNNFLLYRFFITTSNRYAFSGNSFQFDSMGINQANGSSTMSNNILLNSTYPLFTLDVFAGSNFTLSGNITGTGSVTLNPDKGCTGTLILSGTNSYTGATNIEAGTLQAGATTALSSNGGINISSGAVLDLHSYSNTTQYLTGAGSVTLGSGTLTLANGGSQAFSGGISGTGGVTLTTGTQTFSGSNTYYGATTINGGTLQAGSANTFSSNSAFTVGAAGTLSLNGNNNTINSLAGSGTVTLGGSFLTITSGGGNVFSGSFSGVGGFTLNSGTLTLNGNNASLLGTVDTYGTLQVGSTTAFNSNLDVTIHSGGTLALQGNNNTANAVNNFGTLTLGSATLTAGGYIQQSLASLTLDIANVGGTLYGNIVTTNAIILDSLSSLTVTNTGEFNPVTLTKIVLLQSSSSGAQLSGKFPSVTQPFTRGSVRYNYSDNEVYLHIAANCNASWSSASSGNWGNTANWDDACAPGVNNVASDGDIATFPNVSGASSTTVTLANSAGNTAQNVTLAGIDFPASAVAYTIARYSGSGQITLNSGDASAAIIDVSGGDHTINAPLVLGTLSSIQVSSGTSLTLGSSAAITGSQQLNIVAGASGGGRLTNSASWTPSTVVVTGTTLQNQGTIDPTTLTVSGGTVNNQGSSAVISPTTMTVAGGTVYNTASLSATTLTVTGGTLRAGAGGTNTATTFSQTGGTLQFDVQSTSNFGQVSVSSTASLAGTLTVNALSGFSMSTGQIIDLIANSGTLAVTNNGQRVSYQNFPGNVIPTVVYLSNKVQLHVRDTVQHHHSTASIQILNTQIGQHNLLLERKCLQVRYRLVPREYGSILADNELVMSVSDDVNFDALQQETNEKLKRLSGGVNVEAARQEVHEKDQQLTERVTSPQGPDWSAYTGPIASCGSTKTQGVQTGFGYSTVGGLFGFDYACREFDTKFGVGSVVDYRRVWGTAQDDLGRIVSDLIHGSVYGTVIPKRLSNFAIDGIMGFGYHWNSLYRNTGLSLQDVAVGHPKGFIFDCLVAGEYTFSHHSFSAIPKNLSIIPLVNVQYIRQHETAYQEEGAGNFDLAVGKQTAQSATTFLGTRIVYLEPFAHCPLRTEIDLGWQHEYLDEDHTLSVTPFNTSSLPTTVTVVGGGRNSLIASIDFLATIYEKVQVEGAVEYKLNNLFYDTSFYLGIGGEF